MTTKRPVKKASTGDWHPAQVIAELRMRTGLTLSKLSQRHGISRQRISFALHHTAPLAESRIAEALDLHPKAIWPSRYNADGSLPERRGRPTSQQVNSNAARRRVNGNRIDRS